MIRQYARWFLLPIALFAMVDCFADEVKATSHTESTTSNPYQDHYLARPLPANVIEKSDHAPRLLAGNNQASDYISMLQNGYDLLGEADFESGNVPIELLDEQAKRVNSAIVLVYTQITSKPLGSLQISKLKEQQQHKKSTVIEGEATYRYNATFWVKLKPQVIGLHVKPTLKNDQTDGLVVLAVVHDSAAEQAGLEADDLLLAVGDIAIKTPLDLTNAASRYAGKTVDIRYQREGDIKLTSAVLNQAAKK